MLKLNNTHGFSLFEVLIAWAILSTVLFSLMNYQLESLRNTVHAYWQSMAVVRLQSMAERLHSSGSQNAWDNHNKTLLPGGIGQVDCARSRCQISIKWQEQKPQTLTLSVLR